MSAIYEKILQELDVIEAELKKPRVDSAKAAEFIDMAIEELEKLK